MIILIITHYYSVIKARGKRKEESDIWSDVFCIPNSLLNMMEALFSWRWVTTCLTMGSSEYIPYFALPLSAAFGLLIKPSSSQTQVFLLLSSLFSRLSYCRLLSELLCGAQLPARVNTQQCYINQTILDCGLTMYRIPK